MEIDQEKLKVDWVELEKTRAGVAIMARDRLHGLLTYTICPDTVYRPLGVCRTS